MKYLRTLGGLGALAVLVAFGAASPAAATPFGSCTYTYTPPPAVFDPLPPLPCVAVNTNGPVTFTHVFDSNDDLYHDVELDTFGLLTVGSPSSPIEIAFGSGTNATEGGGSNPIDGNAPATTSGNVTNVTVVPGGLSLDITITDLTIQGGTLDTNVVLQLDPSQTSTLTSTQIDNGNGTFTVTSFFDIFTELSLDGGTTFTPSTNADGRQTDTQLMLVDTTPAPEPFSALMIGTGLVGLGALRRRKAKAG